MKCKRSKLERVLIEGDAPSMKDVSALAREVLGDGWKAEMVLYPRGVVAYSVGNQGIDLIQLVVRTGKGDSAKRLVAHIIKSLSAESEGRGDDR